MTDLMYTPLENVFAATMEREGKTVTAWSNPKLFLISLGITIRPKLSSLLVRFPIADTFFLIDYNNVYRLFALCSIRD